MGFIQAGVNPHPFTLNGHKLYFTNSNLMYSYGRFKLGAQAYYFPGTSRNENSVGYFGWGTSGGTSAYPVNPWESSTTNSNYWPMILAGEMPSNADWGRNNRIYTSSGDEIFQLRTPSLAEWNDIANSSRSISTGTKFLYCFCSIDWGAQTGGVMIFSDDYTHPVGAPSISSLNNTNYFNSNIFSVSDYELMNAAGAVFLPNVGYIPNDGSYSVSLNDYGTTYYWSSTAYDSNTAYAEKIMVGTGFGSSQANNINKAYGCVVRLVYDPAL